MAAAMYLLRWSAELKVSGNEIDDYLAKLEEPKRTTLEALRQTILSIVPEAEQGISYGTPAFRLRAARSLGSRLSRTTSATCLTAVPCWVSCRMRSPAT